MSPTAKPTPSPSAWATRTGRTVAAGVVGATVLGSAFLGAGAAGAAPALVCPAGQKPVVSTLGAVCKTVSGTAGTVTRAAPKAVAPVRSAVPKVVAPVRTAPKAVGGAAGAVPSRAPAAGTATKPATAGSAAPASGSAGSASARTAPAPAAAPVAPAAAPVAASAPLVADTATVSAFGVMPASLLARAGAPTGFGALTALAPGARGYDPGLLLSSAVPMRQLTPSPVSSSSSVEALTMLGDGGRIGTPILLSVLSAAAVLALAVRGGVLRRARQREAV